MTINIDAEVVATRYDAARRVNLYTVARGGRCWTVEIPNEHFDKHGRGVGSNGRRRQHLANVLTTAMGGKADGEP